MTHALPVVIIVALFVRMKRRQMTAVEFALLGVALVSLAIIFGQTLVCDGSMPERRYFAQVLTVCAPWGVWGVLQVRGGRWVLASALAALAIFHAIMYAKPHIPGARRHAYVMACNWAAEKIRADWRGPSRDDETAYSSRQYHLPFRPCVHGISPRLGYLVGGRDEFGHIFRNEDIPDYWLNGRNDERFVRKDYELMDVYSCGKYKFELHRRKQQKSNKR